MQIHEAEICLSSCMALRSCLLLPLHGLLIALHQASLIKLIRDAEIELPMHIALFSCSVEQGQGSAVL